MKSRQRETTYIGARFVGAGAAVPTKFATTMRGITIARSGVGTLTLTLDDTWPVINACHISVHSAAGKDALVTPLAAGVYAVQIKTFATDLVAAAAVDLTTAEELQVSAFGCYTGTP